MKILIVVESHFKEYGGPYTAIIQKIEYLNSQKIENKLIYQETNTFKYNLDLEYIIKDYDIVHIYGVWRPFLVKVFFVSKKLNKKIIISPIGALEPWSLSQKKIKKEIAWHMYQKKVLNNADLIHATSEIEAENILKKKINTKIKVIGHGLNIDYKFVPQIKNNHKKNLIFFSRIHKKKGLLELISIWKNLQNSTNWQLHIYGPVSDVKYFTEMITLIKKDKLENKILYFKPEFDTQNKKKILQNADGFILPSKSENFGISIGEALAHALPVLTTLETPWRMINTYKAGYVFGFSKKNIQFHIDKYMSLNNDERYKMGLNGLKLVKEKFDSKKIFKMYENLYRDIL
jgi:glycosyltransferase involved in cell wall biosynthesis